MRLKDIVRAQKSSIKIGAWKTGHIMRSAFPLSKVRGKAYKFGQSYRWRVVQFSALGRRFRVLVLLNERKQKYRATLGLVDGSDLQIFCSYEFHSDEPGWHCHLTCEDDSQVPAGVMRGPWVLRWPGGGKFHRHTKFSVTEENALNIAIDRYQIKETGVLL